MAENSYQFNIQALGGPTVAPINIKAYANSIYMLGTTQVKLNESSVGGIVAGGSSVEGKWTDSRIF